MIFCYVIGKVLNTGNNIMDDTIVGGIKAFAKLENNYTSMPLGRV